MKLIQTKNETALLVKVEGKIDTNTALEFGTQVNDELDDIQNLILDFEKVDYISSLGLRAILELQKRMVKQGNMKVIKVNQSIMYLLSMTGFNNILTVE